MTRPEPSRQSRGVIALRWVLGFGLAVWVGSCNAPEASCANGVCVCEAKADCSIECDAPPCHVDCHDDSSCTAACANGDCTCRPGATCDFECAAPPCHVKCEGDNPACDGACANGQCTCGPGSVCDFVCDAPPCHADCEGASCALTCPDGVDGNCSLDACGGEVVTCEDGRTATCDTPCPET